MHVSKSVLASTLSSSVGLVWGTTRTPDLWGFCGAAAALRLPADAPSKNVEPMWRDDPAPLSAREELAATQIADSERKA